MPIDRSQIDQQLREIGEGEQWWELREFRALPQVLYSGELLRGLALVKVKTRRRPDPVIGARWLLVVTDQRVLCLKQDRVARRQIEIAADQITRIRQRIRIRSVYLIVESSGQRLRMRVRKEGAIRFVTALNKLVPRAPTPALPPDLEPLAWIPGFSTVANLPGVAGIVSKVSMLSPPDPPPLGRLEKLEDRVLELHAEVERLQQQVGFLEELLEKRANEAFLPESTAS